MAKRLFIAEKPSVAQEFAKIFGVNAKRGNGYPDLDERLVKILKESKSVFEIATDFKMK